MIKVSTSPNPFPNSLSLSGFQGLPNTKYYIYSDVVNPKVPTHFGLDGVFQTRNESSPPYEYLGSNIAATFTNGEHIIELKNASGTIIDSAKFTIGTVTPPPTNEPIIEEWVNPSTLTYNVRTASGTYSAPITKI